MTSTLQTATANGPTCRRLRRLDRVLGGGGGVGAPGWCPPFQDAGFGLFEPPALGLFAAVVVPAEGAEVAY